MEQEEQPEPYLFPLSELKLRFPETGAGEAETQLGFQSEPIPNTDSETSSPLPLYTQLHPNQLRLLQFQGEDEVSGSLTYRMETFDISSTPPYYGLSYRWGKGSSSSVIDRTGPFAKLIPTRDDSTSDPPIFTKRITCNGLDTWITENLHSFLQELAKLDRFYFWADQVCINQADSEEKNAQVPLMGRIYAGAVRTLAWAGPLDGQDRVTNETLHFPLKLGKAKAKLLKESRLLSNPVTLQYIGLPASNDLESWVAISDMLSRPWFLRIWVIQEVLLSNETPILIYGDIAINFTIFCSDILWFRDAIERCYVISGGIFYHFLVDDLNLQVCTVAYVTRYANRLSPDKTNRWHLHSLLELVPGMAATDARDLVYGVLGLTEWAEAPEKLPKFLLPDYTVEVGSLYQKCARYSILRSGTLDILRHAAPYGNQRMSECAKQRPTWSPCFTTKVTASVASTVLPNAGLMGRHGKDTLLGYKRNLGYHASAGSSAILSFSPHSYDLILRGIKIEKIQAVMPTWGNENINNSEGNKIPELWESTMDQLGLGEDLPDAELQEFAIKFFSVICPFDGENFSQELSSFTGQRLKDGWAQLMECYASQEDHKFSAETLARYRRFAEGGKLQELRIVLGNRALFITESCILGSGPRDTRQGDLIFVMLGGCHPLLLRECGESFHYVGEVFVRSLMNGEALAAVKAGVLYDQWVKIH